MFAQLAFDLVADVGMFLQKGPDIVAALAQAFGTKGEPGTGFVHDAGFDAHIDEFAFAGHAGAVEDIEQGLAERRRALVFDHFDPAAAAVGFFLVFQGLDAADIQADAGVEFERVAAGGGFRAAVAGHADLHADLVDKDHRRVGFMNGAGEFAHGMGHKPGLAADLGFAHFAFEFGLGNQCGHRVDDHHVHGAGAHQQIGDIQGLFAEVGLGNEQFRGVHAQTPGVVDIECVFGVDKRGRAAEFLGFGDDVQGQRGLARGFRAVNFGDASFGDAAYAERQIEADGAGGDGGDLDVGRIFQAHDGSLAVLAFDGGERGGEGFAAEIFGA